MKMKNIFFTFLFLNLFCFTMVKVSFSKNYQDNLAIMNCLKSADHPMNKTGGPEWDNIDENIALKKYQLGNWTMRVFPVTESSIRNVR